MVGNPKMIRAEINSIDIRQEGDRVHLLYNGRLICTLPHDAALAVARAIHAQAKKAEEWSHAEAIVFDQAILTRLGVPLGLTSHPTLQKEAMKEAAWNSDLRRWIRGKRAGGIESQAVFGTPTVIKEKRK